MVLSYQSSRELLRKELQGNMMVLVLRCGSLAEIAEKVGLKLHASFSVNGAKHPRIGLPYWLVKIGEA
ncbi:hypothetical protein Bca101_016838 [Brassica carinata]